MLIDWFTVIAQIVNFLVLVALLKFFLYGRILRAMERREETIASRLKEAEAREREARYERENHRARLQELEVQREGLIAQTIEEAEASRKQLFREAREEVDRVKGHWLKAVELEKSSFLQMLRQRAAEQILAICRRVLSDLADAKLENQLIEIFRKKLSQMDRESRMTLAATLTRGRHAVITSAFDLAEDAKQEITSLLESSLENELKVTYRTSPELVLGIEVKLPGYKMAWSLDDYLEALEESFLEALEEKTSQ